MNRPLRDAHLRDVHLRDLDIRHPLAPIPSIKLKLQGFVIAVTVAVTVFVFWVGIKVGIWPSVSGVIAALVAMVMVRYLSRDDVAAPRDGLGGRRHGQGRLQPPGDRLLTRDEVGALARAFNGMAAELAETDRMRRDLVANVSHELRTPITALQAQLENLVDGIGDPDPETFRTMLAQVERLGRLVKQLLDLSRLESGRAGARAVRVRRRTPPRAHGARAAAARTRGRGRGQRRTCQPHRRGDPEHVHQVVAKPARRGAVHATRRHRRGARPARHRWRDDRGARRGPGIPESERACSNASTALTRRGPRATAARASASRSPDGSWICTAGRSIPNRGTRTGAEWS